jgi:hypothetical protein
MVAQGLLILVGLAHIIGKSVALALLFATEPAWAAGLVGADLGLMFAYKVVRNDLHIWVPGSGICFAVVYRSVAKLMADFTSLVHLRHPCELGGLGWFVSMALNQVECFLAGWLYSRYYKGSSKFESTVLYTFLASLATLWVVAFVAFLLSIERSHVHTFFSLETGATFCQRDFTDNEGNDALRCQILGYNERLWRPMRVKVAEWVETNWPVWKRDQPPWFTQAWVDSIPDDMLPKSFAATMAPQPALGPAGKLQRGRSTRRSSIFRHLVLEPEATPAMPMPSSDTSERALPDSDNARIEIP